MNLLLDTHVVLWALKTPERLNAKVRKALENPGNVVLVSAISGAEVFIKSTLGKITLEGDFIRATETTGFDSLPLTLQHTEQLAKLPLHHRDPFDRLLVAQALHEGLTLVTHDRKFEPYGVKLLRT